LFQAFKCFIVIISCLSGPGIHQATLVEGDIQFKSNGCIVNFRAAEAATGGIETLAGDNIECGQMAGLLDLDGLLCSLQRMLCGDNEQILFQ